MSSRKFSRALITGIAGSAGSFLAEYLIREQPGLEIHGIARSHSNPSDNLAAIADRVTVHEADLLDFGSVLTVLQNTQPDVLFHLASVANVRASFITPVAVLNNNIVGTANLFEAVRLAKQSPVIELAGTSKVYGHVKAGQIPIKEDAPLSPADPYAVSKIAQDMLGWTYFLSYKMPIIRTRMFGYINPRRADLFASSFARQIALIERGLKQELVHGNLDSLRTFLDMRDVVHACWLGAVHGQPGEVYNIGSTEPVSVKEILERLIALSSVAIPTRLDPQLLRPSDVTLQVPCVDKFVQATGWKPAHSLNNSLKALLDYWRERARTEKEVAHA